MRPVADAVHLDRGQADVRAPVRMIGGSMTDVTRGGQGDFVIYAHRDGETYVAYYKRGWVRWPAERGGWQRRRPCSEDEVEPDDELPTHLAALALRLSGATAS